MLLSLVAVAVVAWELMLMVLAVEVLEDIARELLPLGVLYH
jgi:hypothetical protein